MRFTCEENFDIVPSCVICTIQQPHVLPLNDTETPIFNESAESHLELVSKNHSITYYILSIFL